MFDLSKKKHYVTIDGKKIEVSLEKKLEVLQHGEDTYSIEDGNVVKKKPRAVKSKYKKLLQTDGKGYYFYDDDIHWPEKVAEGGLTWQIEYE
jgi:hypothetical protein